jgi:hypothetical protein
LPANRRQNLVNVKRIAPGAGFQGIGIGRHANEWALGGIEAAQKVTKAHFEQTRNPWSARTAQFMHRLRKKSRKTILWRGCESAHVALTFPASG